MHSLYRESKWALCPSERVVDRYLSEPGGNYFGFPLGRGNFPRFSVRGVLLDTNAELTNLEIRKQHLTTCSYHCAT